MMKEAEEIEEELPKPQSSGSPQLQEEPSLEGAMLEMLTNWEFVEEEASEFVIEQLCLLAEARITLD